LENADKLRRGLQALHYEVPAGAAAIVPVLLGDASLTMRVSEALLERGVLALGIRPPTVPAGTARIRTALMATHSSADLDEALAAFKAVRAEVR
jgi:7-keto-8-aminopelargonate synthetase-like enzyme